MANKDESKAERELQLFKSFCESVGLEFQELSKESPPKPDIRAVDLAGVQRYFELVEVVDQALAKSVADFKSRWMAIEDPLEKAIHKKLAKANRYEVGDASLELLAYWGLQRPSAIEDCASRLIGLSDQLDTSKFSQVWVFDGATTWRVDSASHRGRGRALIGSLLVAHADSLEGLGTSSPHAGMELRCLPCWRWLVTNEADRRSVESSIADYVDHESGLRLAGDLRRIARELQPV